MQKKKYHIILNIAVLFGVAMFLYNCQSEKKDSNINLEADLKFIPTQELFNSNIIRTDSGIAMIRIKAPVIQLYEFDKNNPYTLLPQGGDVEKYDKKGGKPTLIRANWAKIDDMKGLYEGRDHVVMVSEDGDTIKTSHIFWDKKQKKIYNNVKTHIIRPNKDSLIAKNGLESDEKFKNVKLYRTKAITRNTDIKK
ncbi:MAG: LPS export ABC transporter periplasmic protein LptC [Flavobacteriales bacterium]